MVNFENKYNIGDKVFIIQRRPNQGNVLEIRQVAVVGLAYQVRNEGAQVACFFKVDADNPKEPEGIVGQEYAFSSVKEAEQGLVEAGSQVRERYEEEIEELRKQINQKKHERDNIARVKPNEEVYLPKPVDVPAPTPVPTTPDPVAA